MVKINKIQTIMPQWLTSCKIRLVRLQSPESYCNLIASICKKFFSITIERSSDARLGKTVTRVTYNM